MLLASKQDEVSRRQSNYGAEAAAAGRVAPALVGCNMQHAQQQQMAVSLHCLPGFSALQQLTGSVPLVCCAVPAGGAPFRGRAD
jgi:hypothetical protein